jgi:hypothetical protein
MRRIVATSLVLATLTFRRRPTMSESVGIAGREGQIPA